MTQAVKLFTQGPTAGQSQSPGFNSSPKLCHGSPLSRSVRGRWGPGGLLVLSHNSLWSQPPPTQGGPEVKLCHGPEGKGDQNISKQH